MSLPIVPYYVLYDLDGDGVVTQDDVDVLTASVGGGPPPGIPLCRATMGSVISPADVTLATQIKDELIPPIIVLWLTRTATDLLTAPPGSIIPIVDSFEIYVRSEVDAVNTFVMPGSKGHINSLDLRQLDDTVLEVQTSFFGVQGLGFYGNRSGLDIHAQFRISQGWFKLHFDVTHGFNLVVVNYLTLAAMSPDQGLYSLDLSFDETRHLVLQRGSTTLSLPVPASDSPRKFRAVVTPFCHGLQQLDFGVSGSDEGPIWSLPPQTTTPEFDLSVTRPSNTPHTHPLSICGTMPTNPQVIVDDVAALNDIITATICPSGRQARFMCSDPKLIGTRFATLSEVDNADNILDFVDTIAIAGVVETALAKWLAFSGFSDSFNFLLYREDSPMLAFVDLSQLGRTAIRIHLNLTTLEKQPQSNWESLIGPMFPWASYLRSWFVKQVNPSGPVPEPLALALGEHIGRYLGWTPFYLNEPDLGMVLRTTSWLPAMTSAGADAAMRMEATVTFLDNLFGHSIPSDIPSNLVNAINNLNDLQVPGITDEFIELMLRYGYEIIRPPTDDPIILRNFLVLEVPDDYVGIIVPVSEADIDLINSKLVERGGEPLAASFLCDEVDDDDLLVLADCFHIFDFVASDKRERKLLRAWDFGDVPTFFAAVCGGDYLSTLKDRASLLMTPPSPAVMQSQIVQAYRVTRHRLLTSSFFLPIEYTESILMWPDPENLDAVEDLPSSFYDLTSGAANADRLMEQYSEFAPDPVFPDVPAKLAVAGSQAAFEFTALTGTTDLVLTVDREVLFTIFRYE